MLQLAEFDKEQLKDFHSTSTIHDRYRRRHEQLDSELRTLGADRYDRWLPETRSLPLIMYDDEKVMGIVYGRYVHAEADTHLAGRGMLIATNRRILFLDKKPLQVRCEELPYLDVTGVTYSHVGLRDAVTIGSGLGGISVRTFNQNCAQSFVRAIEDHIFVPSPRSSATDD